MKRRLMRRRDHDDEVVTGAKARRGKCRGEEVVVTA
jgi:hypothetical protein